MKLDADEKGLLESFERSEWKSTGGGKRDDHLVPFARGGTIDWDAAMMATQKIGYDGPLVARPAEGWVAAARLTRSGGGT